MQFAQVIIDPQKGKPVLEIIIGKRQLGKYRAFQFIPGPPRRSKVIGSGDNVEQDSKDRFLLDSPLSLDGADIIISSVIFKQTEDPSDLFAVTSILTQDNEPVKSAVPGGPGGVLTVTGTLDKTKPIVLQYDLTVGAEQ